MNTWDKNWMNKCYIEIGSYSDFTVKLYTRKLKPLTPYNSQATTSLSIVNLCLERKFTYMKLIETRSKYNPTVYMCARFDYPMIIAESKSYEFPLGKINVWKITLEERIVNVKPLDSNHELLEFEWAISNE